MAETTAPYKVVFLGDAGVGKTSVLDYQDKNEFSNTKPTTAPGCINVDVPLEDKEVKMCCWDTAGQETFQSMTPLYVRGAHLVVLVYEISSYKSFMNLNTWRKIISENSPDARLFVVGNKSDLHFKREVPGQEASLYARNINAEFIETSAKNGNGINTLFQQIALALSTTQTPDSGAATRLGNSFMSRSDFCC